MPDPVGALATGAALSCAAPAVLAGTLPAFRLRIAARTPTAPRTALGEVSEERRTNGV